MITAASLDAIAGIRHGFFTRQGGVSSGLYDSLNCGFGSGDDPAAVAENRDRAMRALGTEGAALATPWQVHSPDVAVVERPWPRGQAPKVDAVVASRPDVAIGILTADCAPVLFADSEAGVVGAAHAGWKGAVSGVVEATVAAMERLGAVPERIVAAVGPCIAQPSYEVGPEFPTPFLAQSASNARFFRPSERDGHHMFDLPGYVLSRIAAAGVRNAAWVGTDTCADEARFYSWRRTSKRGGRDYGRLLSAITLA